MDMKDDAGNTAVVAILMGSKSDAAVMQGAVDLLKELGIPQQTKIISAHRNPHYTVEYARAARGHGLKVIIAGAGLAAALPGVLAAHTTLPIIGVPINAENSLQGGMDAVSGILQMPPGVPVGCVGINNARNGALLAVAILALTDPVIQKAIETYRAKWNNPQP